MEKNQSSYYYDKTLELVKTNHKVCGCGVIHKVIPKDHKLTYFCGIPTIWFNCSCKTTLVINCKKWVRRCLA